LGGSLKVHVKHGNFGALRSKTAAGRTTNASGTSGDDDNFVFHFLHAALHGWQGCYALHQHHANSKHDIYVNVLTYIT
jgi:hypothetical protein